jgi:hypothetical protein
MGRFAEPARVFGCSVRIRSPETLFASKLGSMCDVLLPKERSRTRAGQGLFYQQTCSQEADMLTQAVPKRFIGLDIHKKYFVAAGVDPKLNQVLGPHEAPMRYLERWAKKNLTCEDAIVVEMTSNTYVVYDTLKPLVHSVTVVHPPHVALIVRAQVKTDKKAALNLAQLHAAGLLPGVWIPPVEVRELRALIAHRRKMVKLSSIAKCRLHALTHRHDIELPEGWEPFSEEMRSWWEHVKVSPLEKHCLTSDLATLDFAKSQVEFIENARRSRQKTSAFLCWCRSRALACSLPSPFSQPLARFRAFLLPSSWWAMLV